MVGASVLLPSIWPRFCLLRWLVFLWTLPAVLLGAGVLLALGLTGNLFVGVIRAGTVEVMFENKGWLIKRLRRAGWGAMPLGPLLLFWGEEQAHRAELCFHVRQHVRQQMLWGPLWFLVYAVMICVGRIQTRSWLEAYEHCYFEKRARTATAAWIASLHKT